MTSTSEPVRQAPEPVRQALLDANWAAAKAREIGFDLCGVAAAPDLAEPERLAEWLARGFAGEMRYLHDPRRSDLASVLPEARSVIVCAVNYDQPLPYSIHTAAQAVVHTAGDAGTIGEPRGWISRYGWGDDYHNVVGEMLDTLLAQLRQRYGDEFAARPYVDTGPISERAAAKVAGIGWLGKNTCLINREIGSFLFLGVIVTSLALAADQGPNEEAYPSSAAKTRDDRGSRKGPYDNVVPDLCGNCSLCIEACPTGALVEPYVMDARRCISYLTIELKGSIPEEFRPAIGWQVFGCDICQDVCPWNKTTTAHATADRTTTSRTTTTAAASATSAAANEKTAAAAFAPRAGLVTPELVWLLRLTEADFREKFRGSPVKRAKWRGLIRNACVAAGNALRKMKNVQNGALEHSELGARLAQLITSDDTVIAEHARWALGQTGSGLPDARVEQDWTED